MKKLFLINALLAIFANTTIPAQAADVFPTSGIFTEVDGESELDFGKRYLGFPDEECSFKKSKRLKANTWRITTICDLADGGKGVKSTATLEKRGKKWRLQRGEYPMDFTK